MRRSLPHLDVLSIHLQPSLAEVHADGGLHAAGEVSGAQPVREAGLPHAGVPDHEHLEGPAARERGGDAPHGAGELQRRLHGAAVCNQPLRDAPRPAWA